jgi:hypothetical protein
MLRSGWRMGRGRRNVEGRRWVRTAVKVEAAIFEG